MTHAKLKLYDVGTGTFSESYDVLCSSVQIGAKYNTTAPPKVNGGSVVEVSKQSFENPTYVLQGVNINDEGTTLTYDKLLEWWKLRNTSTGNYLVLDVDYGVDSSSILPDSAGNKNGIKVVVSNYNINIGLQNSNGQRLGTGSISLIETA